MIDFSKLKPGDWVRLIGYQWEINYLRPDSPYKINPELGLTDPSIRQITAIGDNYAYFKASYNGKTHLSSYTIDNGNWPAELCEPPFKPSKISELRVGDKIRLIGKTWKEKYLLKDAKCGELLPMAGETDNSIRVVTEISGGRAYFNGEYISPGAKASSKSPFYIDESLYSFCIIKPATPAAAPIVQEIKKPEPVIKEIDQSEQENNSSGVGLAAGVALGLLIGVKGWKALKNKNSVVKQKERISEVVSEKA